jgi:hypothetical protein
MATTKGSKVFRTQFASVFVSISAPDNVVSQDLEQTTSTFMFTATVIRTRSNHLSSALFALATSLVMVSCAPSPKSDLPATVEEVEEATESFANFMLDLGIALRTGSLVELESALEPRIVSDGFPRDEGTTTEIRGWVLRRDERARPPSDNDHISRDEFMGGLRSFLDRWSRLEDVRLKVKKSRMVKDVVAGEIALSIVGRDQLGRRAWFRGRAQVHAWMNGSSGGWAIGQFHFTSVETLIADREVFSEVSIPAGIDRVDPQFLARQGPPFAAYGAAVGDVDNDGLVDLVVTSEAGNSLYLNRGDGTFDDVAAAARVRDVHGDVVAPLLLDFDNDGDLDLFFTAIGNQTLFENRLVPDGRLEFWDVSHESGIAVPAIGFSAVAGDIDGNGYPDIYVTSYNRYGQILPDRWDGATNGTPNLLFVNRGDGTFEEVAEERGVADDRWSYAAGFADVDRDGDLDLYSTNDFGGGNSLFINESGSFVDRAEEYGVYDGGYGMGVSFGDYDNDGDLDLHVTRMSSTAGRRILARIGEADLPSRDRLEELALGNSLYENTGAGTFRDVSAGAGPFSAGWAWGGGFIDINNDGFEDLFTPNGFISGSKLHDT